METGEGQVVENQPEKVTGDTGVVKYPEDEIMIPFPSGEVRIPVQPGGWYEWRGRRFYMGDQSASSLSEFAARFLAPSEADDEHHG